MNCKIHGCSEVAIYDGLCLEHYTIHRSSVQSSYDNRPAKGTEYENTAMDLPGFGAAIIEQEVEEAAHDDMQRSISDDLDTSAGDDPFSGGGESGGGGASGDF